MNTKNYQDRAWGLSILLKLLSLGLLLVTGKTIYTDIVQKSAVNLERSQTSSIALLGFGQDTTHQLSSMSVDLTNLIMNTVLAVCLISVLLIAASFFNQISRDKSPFDQTQIRKLKVIARIVLLLALIKPLFYAILLSILSGQLFVYYNLGFLFVTGLILTVMVGVFQYGADLQKSYDETV